MAHPAQSRAGHRRVGRPRNPRGGCGRRASVPRHRGRGPRPPERSRRRRFTGKLECTIDGEPVTRDRAEELARAVGFEVRKSVTKSLDILVVADPHTSSGKAKKARQYGTRIIAETAFWPLIGVTGD